AVFSLFGRLVDEGKTVLMVTHDDDLAHRVSRTVTIADGLIVSDTGHGSATMPQPVAEQMAV
ncbi:MAG: ABC transporter ATP-binding protein, partial [Anaerolineae bacterium]|nr:ABC transporter ATP-binding protein [Anaerolineae bacterium]